LDLFADRTSCHRFLANQFRLLLSAAAYVLVQALRREALAGTDPREAKPASVLCADGTVGDEHVRFLAVVPNSEAKFPQAREGELGLEEGWALARHVREAVAEDGEGDANERRVRRWRIGSGAGSQINLRTGDGQIFLRRAGEERE